jgi:Sulfatase
MSSKEDTTNNKTENALNRRRVLLGGTTLAAASTLNASGPLQILQAQAQPAPSGQRPNILFIMGDDIGWFNIGAYHQGIMASRTPNLDKLAIEGMRFTDYYAEASCTAGRANFITGELPIRTGLTTPQGQVWPSRHRPLLGDGSRRPDGTTTLGCDRQAAHRGCRSPLPEANGDGGR